MTFTLKQRDDGMWEATADPCAFHFEDIHTTLTGGFSCAHTSRKKCVANMISKFTDLMITPLLMAGDYSQPPDASRPQVYITAESDEGTQNDI